MTSERSLTGPKSFDSSHFKCRLLKNEGDATLSFIALIYFEEVQ